MNRNYKYNYKCIVCEKNSVSCVPNQKLCSKDCRKKFYGRIGDENGLSCGTVGALSEILVSADLLKKGYAVFRSLSPACFCDLIAIKGDEMKKIEVRTGYKMVHSNKIFFPKKLSTINGIPNEYAAYVNAENKVYYEKVTEEDINKYGK